ncbi:MAG: hypothetical protein AAF391_13025, partial [Bacteroidota bacterium]
MLGMHRCGTSAITRLISMLGAELPKRVIGAGPGNQIGHWEPSRFVEYNDQLLSELHSSWHDWDRLDLKKLSSARREQISTDIKDIIAEDFGTARIFVLKDPRISRFASFFLQSLRNSGINVSVLITFRNPLDVIDSLMARREFWPTNLDRTDAALLWLSHLLPAELAARDLPHALLSYERVLDNPADSIQNAVSLIDIDLPISVSQTKSDLNSFIDNAHRHHKHRPDEVLLDPQLAGWVTDCYSALLDLEAQRNVVHAHETLDLIRSQFYAALPLLKEVAVARRKATKDTQTALGQLEEAQRQCQELS